MEDVDHECETCGTTLFLRDLAGRPRTIRLALTATVAELHAHIERNTSVVASHMRLCIVGGKQLSKSSVTLAEYGVKVGTELQLLGRIVGGVKKKVKGKTKEVKGKRTGVTRLHELAKTGAVQDLKKALEEEGTEEALKAPNDFGLLPIHYAAESNESPEVMQYLVEQGGVETIEAEETDKKLPIHLAAENEQSMQVMKALLEHVPADVLDPAEKLAGEISEMKTGALRKKAKELGVSQDQIRGTWLDKLEDEDGEKEALKELILENHPATKLVAEWRRKTFETLKHPDVHGKLPIHHAAVSSKLEVVTYIAKCGPETVWKRDKSFNTALDIGKTSEHLDVKHWARTFDCALGRYKVDEKRPVHHR